MTASVVKDDPGAASHRTFGMNTQGSITREAKMRAAAIVTMVLLGLSGSIDAVAAQQASGCKVCRDQHAACMKNYAGPTCKTEYQMCMKSCKPK
jgi:hypothetical protein